MPRKANSGKEDYVNQVSGRDKAFTDALGSVQRKYGQRSIILMSEKPAAVEVISTGSIAIDIATNIGGIPRGCITELFGQESSGKSTIALHMVASAQREARERYEKWASMSDAERAAVPEPPMYAKCVYVDMEHALNTEWANDIGVDVDRLHISQPDDAEQALDIVEVMIRSGAVDIIVVDSVDALVPRATVEGEIGDVTVALQARLMSQSLRKISPALSGSNTALVFINQVRDVINAMAFGPKTNTSGGRALKFYAHMRINVSRIQTVKEGQDSIGIRVKAEVVKNKKAAPFKKAETVILWHEGGVSREEEVIDLGEEAGYIEKRGAFYRLASNQLSLGQGKPAVRTYLREHPELQRELEVAVRDYYLNGLVPSGVSEDEEEFIEEDG